MKQTANCYGSKGFCSASKMVQMSCLHDAQCGSFMIFAIVAPQIASFHQNVRFCNRWRKILEPLDGATFTSLYSSKFAGGLGRRAASFRKEVPTPTEQPRVTLDGAVVTFPNRNRNYLERIIWNFS